MLSYLTLMLYENILRRASAQRALIAVIFPSIMSPLTPQQPARSSRPNEGGQQSLTARRLGLSQEIARYQMGVRTMLVAGVGCSLCLWAELLPIGSFLDGRRLGGKPGRPHCRRLLTDLSILHSRRLVADSIGLSPSHFRHLREGLPVRAVQASSGDAGFPSPTRVGPHNGPQWLRSRIVHHHVELLTGRVGTLESVIEVKSSTPNFPARVCVPSREPSLPGARSPHASPIKSRLQPRRKGRRQTAIRGSCRQLGYPSGCRDLSGRRHTATPRCLCPRIRPRS